MRISGGSAKGRKVILKKAFLQKSDADELRPTSGKVRESVFNILGPRITESRFLDLYAGTGAVGLEALSRGASDAVFVDISAQRVKLIRDLAGRFGLGEQAVTAQTDALSFLNNNERPFDIIFVDPPYASGEIDRILTLLDNDEILNPDGTIIIEHAKKTSLPERLEQSVLKKCYKYGDTMLSLYRKEQP
jgi:16S rRNA (guanine(966)-N(2))-methyltransferase RsmD